MNGRKAKILRRIAFAATAHKPEEARKKYVAERRRYGGRTGPVTLHPSCMRGFYQSLKRRVKQYGMQHVLESINRVTAGMSGA